MSAPPFEASTTHTIRGVQTRVFEAGPGTSKARAIVLLHGNPDTHDVWSGVVEKPKSTYRCIAPDLPGYGDSVEPKGFAFKLENMAAWVDGLLDAMKLPRADLVIHDVGVPYGLAFATLHPERLRSLTILNGSFFPETKWHFWARVWRTPVLGELTMLLASRGLFVSEMKKGSPQMPKDYPPRAWAQYSMHTRFQVLRFYRAMNFPQTFIGWDVKLLQAIQQVPTQVLWGEQDPYLPDWIPERFGKPLTRYPDCGHWLMLEKPDEVAAKVAALVGH